MSTDMEDDIPDSRPDHKCETLNTIRDSVLQTAIAHGFTDATIAEDIALMHSELSEALEDHRDHHAPDEVWYEATSVGQKPRGIPSEMADVIIRVLHFCGKYKIDIQTAVNEKMAYNDARPFKHGKAL